MKKEDFLQKIEKREAVIGIIGLGYVGLPLLLTFSKNGFRTIGFDIDEKKCIECQLCYIACEDGAHQAIGLSKADDSRIPYIIEENCVGCNLCSLVCPVENCITMVRRDSGENHETWAEYLTNDKAPNSFNDDRAGGKGHWVPNPSDALKNGKKNG